MLFRSATAGVKIERIVIKIFFIFLPYIERPQKNYTLVFATKYQFMAYFMIDIAEITAVSDLNIFSLIFNG